MRKITSFTHVLAVNDLDSSRRFYREELGFRNGLGNRLPKQGIKSEARVKLRSALVSDVETLFDIRCSVVENHQSREELTTLGVTVESVHEMIESGDFVSTIAERDEQPVGFTIAQISEGYIFACFVRPEFEKQGIGQALMDAAEEGLYRAGVEQAWLSTGPGQHLRAIGFYRRLGWTDDGYLEDGQVRFRKTLQDSEQRDPTDS